MTIYFCHYFLFLLPYYNSQFHLLLCDLYIVAFWKGSTAKVCSFPASRRRRRGDVLPIRRCSAHPTMFCPSNDILPVRWCSAHPMMLCPSDDALPIHWCFARPHRGTSSAVAPASPRDAGNQLGALTCPNKREPGPALTSVLPLRGGFWVNGISLMLLIGAGLIHLCNERV